MRDRVVLFAIVGFGFLPCGISNAQQALPVQSTASSDRDSVKSATPSATTAVWIAGANRLAVSNQPLAPADRLLLLLGIERRFEWAKVRWGTVFVAPSVLPGVYTTGNRRTVLVPCGVFDLCSVGAKYAAFGVGAIPLGIRFESLPLGRASLAARLDGGGVWFDRRIPGDGAMHFNFLAQAGLDLSLQVATRSWIQLGYRHLHLSNAGTGKANPGLDVSLLNLGLAWR